jgi:hypothetical protein
MLCFLVFRIPDDEQSPETQCFSVTVYVVAAVSESAAEERHLGNDNRNYKEHFGYQRMARENGTCAEIQLVFMFN